MKQADKEIGVLNAIFHNLAVQQIQVVKGDNKKQALICVMRRLVNIIYSMMKHKTEYRAATLTERLVS